jgi:hypothetical protein
LKFLIKSSYKNNLNYFNSISYIKYFYVLDLIKKKQFFKKTKKGVKLDSRFDSIRRFKNINLNNQLINIWLKNGLKLNLLKHYNLFLEIFFYKLISNVNFYENYTNYNYVLELLDTKDYYYKFENLLNDPIKELEYIFDLKIKKLNKKLQKKYNKKYDYKIVHINKKKRVRYLLKVFYSNINHYKYNKYSERIFFTLINLVFDTKKTEVWDKKITTYKTVFKFLNKNN